jgi:hypothetical protein
MTLLLEILCELAGLFGVFERGFLMFMALLGMLFLAAKFSVYDHPLWTFGGVAVVMLVGCVSDRFSKSSSQDA